MQTSLRGSSCIHLLQNCKSLDQVKQIQGRIFHLGLHQNASIVKKLMVFCSDPCNGNVSYGERIFNYVQQPCLFMYNLMLKASAKRGRFRKTLQLFAQMREDGVLPDNFTYPFVCKAIGRLGEVFHGCKVHGFVTKTGLVFDPFVCNSLVDMYGHLGEVSVMKKLFDEMPRRDVVAWNVLISGLVNCQRFEDAIDLFCAMRTGGHLKPNEATIVSTLSACACVKNLELGKEIHSYVSDQALFTCIVKNALMDMYCKCGWVSVARAIFEMETHGRNVVCWTTMVSGYVNSGDVEEARKLFDMSPTRDLILWTVMISGYVQFNRFDEALNLFNEMQVAGVKPDKFILVPLLTGCAQTGAQEIGEWIHRYVSASRIPIDAVVGTAIVEMYAKCGAIDKAMDVFRVISEKDAASWTSIICGLALNGRTNDALNLFLEMKQAAAEPDWITFIGVLNACSHGGLVEEGRDLFNSMTSLHNLKPKLEHYGCLVDLFGRAGRLEEAAELLIEMMKGEQVGSMADTLYGSLLSACRTYGNGETGKRVAEMLAKSTTLGDPGVHLLLANFYASVDRWGDVMKVRRKMKDLGVRKVPGCSSIEINGVVHEFFVDANQLD